MPPGRGRLHATSFSENLGGTGAYYKGIKGMGEGKIRAAKRIVDTEELIILENKIIAKINESRDKDFIDYYNQAVKHMNNGRLEIAKVYVKKAKEIKSTKELESLEKRIEKKIRNKTN